jgi:lipase (class 3)
MTVQNLPLRQIMASFAYLAYCGEQITTPSPEQQILDLINTAMPKIPPIAAPNPVWRVVWGPVAYTVPGALYQDSLMFVVQNQTDTTQFAIAIRGTNFISDLDWLMEDLDILQMLPWPQAQTGAQISESTSIALQIVLAMQGKCSLSDQASVLDFLKSQTEKPINLCVTGHSLGGCLAGTLALYLKDNRANWDSSGKSPVCAISFAAPTAGNVAFAGYSDGQFKGGGEFPGWDLSLETNCDPVRCSLDVAPLAWTAAAVTIPSDADYPPLLTIYGNNPDFENLGFTGAAFATALSYVCPWLVALLSPRNYQQVVAGATNLVGVFNPQYAPASDNLEDYLTAFVAQAEYQHSDSYPSLLDVPQLNDPTIIITNPAEPLTKAAQRPLGRPRGRPPRSCKGRDRGMAAPRRSKYAKCSDMSDALRIRSAGQGSCRSA